MTTFHINHVSGDDAKDGSSWANAWKSITNGALAARIAPGDYIKIAKSPDPTSIGNATWSNGSKTVTLAAPLTATIDMCATAWTAATSDITQSVITTRKEGANAVQLVVGVAFTSGKIAYKTLASTDFSGYQQISLWIKPTIAISVLKICLCSDTSGNTIVDELILPALVASYWQSITLNKGSALGSAIQSVALYAIVDPGTPTIVLDNIIACKSSASADSLSLSSLISKNSAAYGGTEDWYGIQSINGTTVLLDNEPSTSADAGRGYYGTTETVTTYKRDAIVISASETINETGTELARTTYDFGYNTSTDLQDGETFLDGVSGAISIGLSATAGMGYLNISRLSCVRFNSGITILSINNNLDLGSCNNNNTTGLSTTNFNQITMRGCCNNGNQGIVIAAGFNNSKLSVINLLGNLGLGIALTACVSSKLYITNCFNNQTYGISLTDCLDILMQVHTAGNGTAGIYQSGGFNYLNKSVIEEATEVAGITLGAKLFSTLHDDTAMYHKTYMLGATIASQSAVKQTVSGVAWKISPTSTARNSFNPVIMPVARIAVTAGEAISVFAWFLRDSIDITGKLVCRANQLDGLTTDAIDTISVGADTWEELSVTFTPTENGVVEIEAVVYGGTTYSVYVDSIRVS